jgi:hypothetical protein
MIHRHRVPLFAFQSFIGSFDALAHSCASHPLSCKCSAHPGLSSTVTALVVYQAWLCPQVRCCLIHHEDLNRSFILCIILRIVLSLIVRIMPTPSRLSISHKLASSWNKYSSSLCYHQSLWKSSSRPDMHLIACSERVIVICSMLFLMDSSQLVKSDSGKKCLDIINDVHVITHIHTMKCAFELQNKLSHSQSSWWVPFPTFIQCNCVITFVDNHVSNDDNMRLSFKCSIVPQLVLVVCTSFQYSFKYNCIPTSVDSHVSKDDDMKISFKCIFAFPIVDGVH